MNPELEVLLAGQSVGHLIDDAARGWSFVYNDDALRQAQTNPVGIALPRNRSAHHGDSVRAVFSNLLPDGSLRTRAARSLGLSGNNDFALLGRLGGECAGALSLRPPGGHKPIAENRRTLDDAELRNLVAVLPVHPLLADAESLRKSLPGEFDKLPVCIENNQVSIVLDDSLTTHIIKTAKPGLRESLHNEAWCMGLAQACQLPVAPYKIISGRVNLLAVERVDRTAGATPVALHMEDFCQILGYLPHYKYAREGGPRLEDIVRCLRRISVTPARDLRHLLRWLIFSFLIGFGAAHAKQIAMLHGPRGPYLAPFFGLWSTHVYPEMNFRLGFSIADEDRPDWLTAQRWREFAHALGVKPGYLLDLLGGMAEALPQLAASFSEQFQRRHGFVEISRQIRALLTQRCRQVLVSLELEP